MDTDGSDKGKNEKRNVYKKEDVSWSNIHITNEVREGLLVEVLIQHSGQTSAQRQSGKKLEEKRKCSKRKRG